MNDSHQEQQPQQEPADEELDPEIEALLDFEPAPVKHKRAKAWDASRQRRFIAELARVGTAEQAAAAVHMDSFGATKVRRREGGEEFGAAWDAALDLYREREEARLDAERAAAPPVGAIRWSGRKGLKGRPLN